VSCYNKTELTVHSLHIIQHSSSHCSDNCSNLENQSKLVGNINPVKQTTTENLNEETKLVKLTSQTASNIYNPWPTASSNKTYRQHSIRPPAREPSTCGTCGNLTTYQYSVPIVNRYTTLSNCQELQPTCARTLPSNGKYPPRFMVTKNHKYITRSPKEERITTNQHGSSGTFLSNTRNLQERGESDGETNHIPNIINGTTNMTHTPQSNLGNNMSVCNLLNELRETINVNSRESCLPSKKHKVV